MAIAKDPSAARKLTIKRNTVAVVTDGSAVLGLGNIGPEAALPVMEGKALLFKRFAGIDAWPVCLATQDVDEIVRIVQCIAPVYGGINLEDISAPRCFEIERRLRDLLDIPVFHDDQHGTAIVVSRPSQRPAGGRQGDEGRARRRARRRGGRRRHLQVAVERRASATSSASIAAASSRPTTSASTPSAVGWPRTPTRTSEPAP